MTASLVDAADDFIAACRDAQRRGEDVPLTGNLQAWAAAQHAAAERAAAPSHVKMRVTNHAEKIYTSEKVWDPSIGAHINGVVVMITPPRQAGGFSFPAGETRVVDVPRDRVLEVVGCSSLKVERL